MDEPKEVGEPMKCSCCGKHIKKGERYFKVPGLYYHCCSAECLLEAVYPTYHVAISTGYEPEE